MEPSYIHPPPPRASDSDPGDFPPRPAGWRSPSLPPLPPKGCDLRDQEASDCLLSANTPLFLPGIQETLVTRGVSRQPASRGRASTWGQAKCLSASPVAAAERGRRLGGGMVSCESCPLLSPPPPPSPTQLYPNTANSSNSRSGTPLGGLWTNHRCPFAPCGQL